MVEKALGLFIVVIVVYAFALWAVDNVPKLMAG